MDIKKIVCYMILNLSSIDTLRKLGSFFPLLLSFSVFISVHLLVFYFNYPFKVENIFAVCLGNIECNEALFSHSTCVDIVM